MAHTIRYLHKEVGIIHRDIEPENLLFEPIDIVPSVNPIFKLREVVIRIIKEMKVIFKLVLMMVVEYYTIYKILLIVLVAPLISR